MLSDKLLLLWNDFFFTLVKCLYLVVTTNNEIMCVLDGELDFFTNKHLVVFKTFVPEVVRYHDMLTYFVPLCLVSSLSMSFLDVFSACVVCSLTSNYQVS